MNVKEYLAKEINTEEIQVEDLVIHVKTWMPCNEQENMAVEWAEKTVIFDEENGHAFMSHLEDMVFSYILLKYATDFPIGELSVEEVYNFALRAQIWDKIQVAINGYVWLVRDMYHSICCNMIRSFEKQHDLGTLLRKTFGFLLTGEDISETLAKSADIVNRMVEVMGVFQEHEDSKMKNSPQMKVGGVPLNFAKK